MLKKIVAKVKSIRTHIVDSITRRPDVNVSGLKPEEKVFKESVEEECRRALGKIRKRVPNARISVHVKSSLKGKGKWYEIKGTLELPGGSMYASASDRELYGALIRVLYEFQEEARRVKSYGKKGGFK